MLDSIYHRLLELLNLSGKNGSFRNRENLQYKKTADLLLTCFLLLLPLLESVIVLYFVMRYFMSILVLQSS